MTFPVHLKTRRRLAILFSVPLAFSLLFFFVNQTAEHRETTLLEVQRLSASVTQLRARARDAEAGERGFYLTGQTSYLFPLAQAQASLAASERQSLASVQERPRYQPQLAALLRLVRTRFEEANEGVEEKRAGRLTDELLARRLEQGQVTMDQIRNLSRDLLQQLEREEISVLDAQRAASRGSFVFFCIGSFLMIGVIIWLYNALLRYLAERNAANENLMAANIYLEARINERTLDLTRANDELQQFAYVASHDLQEPLRTITSFSQLLAARYKGRLDADADEFIGYIVSASRRMTDLINGLLAMVRLRKSGQPPTPVSFVDLLEDAKISLQAAIRESHATVEHGPLPSLVVDAVQLTQVLQNLLSNAIKYRREEPPSIRVEADRDAANWTFAITDNGQGFDPQFAERIFGIFQRLQHREVEGTGMGLSIARQIIERHGGRMWAVSQEGSGSTFFFSLPVTLEARREGTSEESPDPASSK